MSHAYPLHIPLTLTYNVLDWQDQQLAPLLLNDQPLPTAQTLTLPAISGYFYPLGGIVTLVFAELAPQDRRWIAAACQQPVTITLPDNLKYGYVRGPATATLVGLTLTITLSQKVAVNFIGGTYGFY